MFKKYRTVTTLQVSYVQDIWEVADQFNRVSITVEATSPESAWESIEAETGTLLGG